MIDKRYMGGVIKDSRSVGDTYSMLRWCVV